VSSGVLFAKQTLRGFLAQVTTALVSIYTVDECVCVLILPKITQAENIFAMIGEHKGDSVLYSQT
jgi:hypothetical protein